MGKKKGKGISTQSSAKDLTVPGLDLRNYVFYTDPLSKENLHRPSSSETASKRTSGSSQASMATSPSAQLIQSKRTVDYNTTLDENADLEEASHSGPSAIPVRRLETSYYARMAAEESEAQEHNKSSLHNPKIRIKLANMKRHRPWFLGIMTIIQVGTLIASFVLNYRVMKLPIEVTPNFNYMIGPASGVLISMGARFVPCMRTGTGYEDYSEIVCPDGIVGSITADDGTIVCSLSDICGFGGIHNKKPGQIYRFLMSLGLHGGILHLAFNLSFQVRTGFQMERDFGWWRIGAIYIITGVLGFIFGANFNPLTPSVGCSGSLYGLMACLLLDLFQNWRLISKPWTELFKMGIQIFISLMIGMLPYIDNFAHIGGFFSGVLAGLVFMPTIHFGTWDKWRKRALLGVAAPALAVLCYFLVKSFYGSASSCTWCKYLNCIPGLPWCSTKWAAAVSGT
ncbi:hypothetical protein HKX48_006225 [Thoreauomyces humboldtii]|nr:hypothetical protein HKX48_006225 [Thoreauomyces humboldtii]